MNRRYEIRELVETDVPGYLQFLKSNALLPVYGTPSFLSFLEAACGCQTHVLVAITDSTIVGSLPFAVAQCAGIGRVVNSLPWYGSHGSIVLNRTAANDNDSEEIRRSLLARFVSAIDGEDLLSATMILLPDEELHLQTYKDVLQPVQMDLRIGQMTNLPPGGENSSGHLEAVLKQKTRNLVRKSLKQGFVEIVTDAPWAWEFLAKTHSENMAAIGGKAKPVEHFQAMRALLPPEMLRLSIALSGDAPTAALLLLVSGETYEYITPVISKAFRPLQPLSFLIWMGMLDAIRSGCRRWNWGGTWSGQENLHHFKAGFGASDHPYSYLIKATKTSVERLQELKPQLGTLFPYFYVYPYEAL